MFTVRKLESLPPRTRLRKLLHLIREAEELLLAGGSPQTDLIRRALASPVVLQRLGDGPRVAAAAAASRLETSGRELHRALGGLRHLLMQELGVETAEWDLLLPDTRAESPRDRVVYPARVYLEDIRSPYNVGSIFRTAEAFGAGHIHLSPATPPPSHPRARRTSRGCTDIVPWSVCALSDLEAGLPVFALETGGTPTWRFDYPDKGVVLIGSEELGLSPEALRRAEESLGRVSIPMAGARRSLNVAVAFGILMDHWHRHLVGT